MKAPTIDAAVERIEGGDRQPLYLVIGEQVVATREATRIAEALATAAGCKVVLHKGAAGAELGSILADLFTFSLFEAAKVALVVGSAELADRDAAAELIDEAAKVLGDDYGLAGVTGEGLSVAERKAAGPLLQTLRLFGIDPVAGAAGEAIAALPDSALAGGKSQRKGGRRGRPKKERVQLARGLSALLEAARAEDLTGWSTSNLAELDRAAEGGLPEGHALVFAERSVDRKHPLVRRLLDRNVAFEVGELGLDGKGRATGLDPVVAELERETGVGIDRAGAQELARRTLRKEGWGASVADAASAARFAAEYRKIAAGMPEGAGRIDRAAVEESVVDRGEQDVWDVFNAMEGQKPDAALAALRRYFDGAADRQGERFRFLSLLAGRCQQLTAAHGIGMAHSLPEARNFNGFKAKVLPKLMTEWPRGVKKPGPWPLFNVYKAAMARRSPESVAAMNELPWRVLEAETRLRGGSGDDAAALEALVLAVAGGGLTDSGNAASPVPRDASRAPASPRGAGPGARRSSGLGGRRRR
ncbi:MAG: hypothetical protein OXG81_02595 [Acidobacteria bacterium]|nr:hypothetical protein [Acidobacteriota bacterium]